MHFVTDGLLIHWKSCLIECATALQTLFPAEMGIGMALVHAMLYVVAFVFARRMVHVWLAQLGS